MKTLSPETNNNYELASKLSWMLDDMESFDLIELFKANALGGGRVDSKRVEPDKQKMARLLRRSELNLS